MHDFEALLAVSRRACLGSVERAFIAAYKNLLSRFIENSGASSRPTQISNRLYQLLHCAGSHEARELVSRLESALSARPNAMSSGVAKSAKVQDGGSRRHSTFDTKEFLATRGRCVASHKEVRNIHALLEYA